MKAASANKNEMNPHQYAKHMARYGHKDWLVWTGKDGREIAEVKTADSLKRAMLATGTQKDFRMYGANDGCGFIVHWSMALIMWKNAKRNIGVQ